MNARYYLKHKHSDLPQIMPPIAHTGESDTGQPQFPMNVFQHSCDCDNEFYPTRPIQAVVVSSCITVDRGGLSCVL